VELFFPIIGWSSWQSLMWYYLWDGLLCIFGRWEPQHLLVCAPNLELKVILYSSVGARGFWKRRVPTAIGKEVTGEFFVSDTQVLWVEETSAKVEMRFIRLKWDLCLNLREMFNFVYYLLLIEWRNQLNGETIDYVHRLCPWSNVILTFKICRVVITFKYIYWRW
jgi:hypothetical protein